MIEQFIGQPAAWNLRHTKATLDGESIEIEATGLLARAIQHEVDHLNGILFVDRMSSAAKASLASRLKRMQKETQRGHGKDPQSLVGQSAL